MFRSQTLEWRYKLVWRKSKSQKDDTLIDDPVELAKVDMLLSRDDCEVMCFYDMAVASSIFSRLRFMFSLSRWTQIKHSLNQSKRNVIVRL